MWCSITWNNSLSLEKKKKGPRHCKSLLDHSTQYMLGILVPTLKIGQWLWKSTTFCTFLGINCKSYLDQGYEGNRKRSQYSKIPMFSVWLGHSQMEKQQIAAMMVRKQRHYSQQDHQALNLRSLGFPWSRPRIMIIMISILSTTYVLSKGKISCSFLFFV